MMTVKCKACRRRIRFITSTRGKPMPCDPELQVRHVVLPGEGTVATKAARVSLITIYGAVVVAWEAPAGHPHITRLEGYVSHFATCPGADQFRRAPSPDPARPLPRLRTPS